ncbi:MAG: GTP-binding protein [Methanobacteriota archaeon]
MDYSSIEKQIKDIEDEIFKTQKNKNTEHHIGKLKAKIARLQEEVEKRKSSGAKIKGFAVKKSGDATVGIVGFPSIGKSTLLNQLTGASSKVGDYDFTTLQTVPGMMKYKGAEIQLLDLPGLIEGASKGKGRGREVIAAVRNVDLLMLMIDPYQWKRFDPILQELVLAGLRLNQKQPNVVIRKTNHGGITVSSTISLTKMDDLMIKTIASEFLINGSVTIREDITEDQLIDVFSVNREYVPAIVIMNKIDLAEEKLVEETKRYLQHKGWTVITISAKNRANLEELKEAIFTHLRLIRIYLKPVGKQPDYQEPLIFKEDATVEDVCKRLHREFKRKFRYAHIWGPSAKHVGQKVGLEHRLKDTDVVTILITRS